MTTDWLFHAWLQIAEAFLFALILFDLAAIAVVIALAAVERILRRPLLREPVTLQDVARQVAEIRKEQDEKQVNVVIHRKIEITKDDAEKVINRICNGHNFRARLLNGGGGL